MRVPLCSTYLRPVAVGVKTTTKCCSSIPLRYHGVFKHFCCNAVIEQENQHGWREGELQFNCEAFFFLPSYLCFNFLTFGWALTFTHCPSASCFSSTASFFCFFQLSLFFRQPRASHSFLNSRSSFFFINLSVFQWCFLLISFVFEFVSVMVYSGYKKRRMLQFYFQACWSPAI